MGEKIFALGLLVLTIVTLLLALEIHEMRIEMQGEPLEIEPIGQTDIPQGIRV